MANLAPCKGCPDRSTGPRSTDCHATCERYAAFVAAKAAERTQRRLENQVYSAMMQGNRRIKEIPPISIFSIISSSLAPEATVASNG